MFTGIVEHLGAVKHVFKTPSGLGIEINFLSPARMLKIGESIAVNGVCLTVTKFQGQCFCADIVRATLKTTTLGDLKKGDEVHLERALKKGARFGGHYLTGHVDGRGRVTRIEAEGRSKWIWLRVPNEVQKYVQAKGSIAVNGVSLTLQAVDRGVVKIALIPHTLQQTLFSKLKVKQFVNIETDALLRGSKAGVLAVRQASEGSGKLQRRIQRLIQLGF